MKPFAAAFSALLIFCTSVLADVPSMARDANIVFLGEVHDNPNHHETQADWVAALQPAALVFEMIAPDVAAGLSAADRSDSETLGNALGWAASGWPDFEMYAPLFFTAPNARIYGAAVPRSMARQILSDGLSVAMTLEDRQRFGLERDLPAAQQTAREAHQMAAHCDALPKDLMPGMVLIQRVRDAWLAQQALAALQDTGGPVVVITGNGHARRDWGAPAAIAQADTTVAVYALGQSEDGAAQSGAFDHVVDAPAAERPDPCAAFK